MPISNCCEECLKWEQFGDKCWVYWEEKKECTQKVENAEELSLHNTIQ